MKIGILGSGKGSNFEAIFQSILERRLQAQIVVVVSDCQDAAILEKAKKSGIPAFYIAPGKYRTFLEKPIEEKYLQCLKEHGVEWLVLAGFMRVLKGSFFEAYPGRILNIHPSLLPSFRGLDAWRQALEYGVKVTGCTVHFVDEDVDTGPIILQESVPVYDGDSSDSLHHRIQDAEHRLYPKALQLIVENRLEVKGRKVVIKS
jgi:phosphoribosylglycinamide formyltransferase-1